MHNLLLGTAKYQTMWKDDGILTKAQFEYIQQEVDAIKVPASVGRIPYKIGSNFSGFTADQWKNWVCIYSTLCLKELLPAEHYECWVLFQDACCSLLQPSLSTFQLSIADSKLYEFCKAYEVLYGKEKCTPNMPEEIREFFMAHVGKCGEISLGEGSLIQTHVDSSDLLNYKKSSFCIPSEINATEGPMYTLYRRYERLFDSSEVESLTKVYQALYPCVALPHIPMVHEIFHELKVFNETIVSSKSKGNHSSAVCANWAGVGGNLATTNAVVRVGLIQSFIRHTIRFPVSPTESKKLVHMFARVFWYKSHPRENWFHHRALVLSPDMNSYGPATFLPISRIRCRCGIANKTVKFDYGKDTVNIAIMCGANYSV